MEDDVLKSIRRGRPKIMIDWERFREYRLEGLTISDISKVMNISRRTLTKRIQEQKIKMGIIKK